MATKTFGLVDLFESAPRAKALIDRKTTQYMGPCVVQSPGSWTRVGPTWLVPGVGWVTVGPGARTWGTSEGLAELATQPTATPGWHAVGISVSPEPTLVFAITEEVIRADYMDQIRAFSDEAETIEESR